MTQRWLRSAEVLARPLTRGSAVLAADGRYAATLRDLDDDVWGLLTEPATTSQLTERLAHLRRHDPPAEASVDAALTRLARAGLVREASQESRP
jgi:hypothetical protein